MGKQNHWEKSSNRPANEHQLIKVEKQVGCRDRPQPASAKRKSQRGIAFLAVGLILGLTDCASVGVRNPTQGDANPNLPSHIFVTEFDAGKGIFQVNRSGDELVAFEQKTAGALADHLVADLPNALMQRDTKFSPLFRLPPGPFNSIGRSDRSDAGKNFRLLDWLLTQMERINAN